MTLITLLGISLVVVLIVIISMISGRRVQDADDFLTSGGKSGTFMVCGSILGSLLSSQAVIGTVQLAFHLGYSAWWFTLGAGIGCLILSLFYSSPIRASGSKTELQIISAEYGSVAESLGSILCSMGNKNSCRSNDHNRKSETS